MSNNYWLEQYNKDVLVKEIREHLDKKYGGIYDPSQVSEIAKEISNYLLKHGKTKYKVYVRLAFDTGELTLEIP